MVIGAGNTEPSALADALEHATPDARKLYERYGEQARNIHGPNSTSLDIKFVLSALITNVET